jgi:hypothetical protein
LNRRIPKIDWAKANHRKQRVEGKPMKRSRAIGYDIDSPNGLGCGKD